MDANEFLFDALLNFRSRNPASPDPASAFVMGCAANMRASPAQLFQDLFVLFMLKFKRNGFFVEFGATNGVTLSNTVLLERQFGWKGILAEAAKCWHNDLKANRSAKIDFRCVWEETGKQLEFNETPYAELSTIHALSDKDGHRDSRREGKKYMVDTVSLNDLLATHQCPCEIDYMSIDTEGSELAILKAFDFSKYNINVLTVEHNFQQPDRDSINMLLADKGFIRVFEPLSKWDDWFVRSSLLAG